MGKFKDQMLDHMQVLGFSEDTKRMYAFCMEKFVQHFNKAPDLLTLKDVYDFQHHLRLKKNVSRSTLNVYKAAIQFFYHKVLKKEWTFQGNINVRKEKKLPDVLTKEEISKLLKTNINLKDKAIIMTMYATGMRVSEASRLKKEDIDSARMLIHIRQGKGNKDRNAILSPVLLELLRNYYKSSKRKSEVYFFPGQKKDSQITRKAIFKNVKKAAKLAGLKKNVSPHTLRHSFATHLLEDGVNLKKIQALLGHTSLVTTSKYIHLANNFTKSVSSPLDSINLD